MSRSSIPTSFNFLMLPLTTASFLPPPSIIFLLARSAADAVFCYLLFVAATMSSIAFEATATVVPVTDHQWMYVGFLPGFLWLHPALLIFLGIF